MDRQLSYARTPDGLSLAWYAVGRGMPLVWMPRGPTDQHPVRMAFTFSDRGEHEMKGFGDAGRLYEVRWRE